MPEVGWPEPAIALGRIESTRSCCPRSRQRSAGSHGCNVTPDARIAPASAVGARTERVDRLPLPRSPGNGRAGADDARRRRLGRHLQPDDLPEGDVGRHALRRAAAGAESCGPARRVLRAGCARRRQWVRPDAQRLGRRGGPAWLRVDRGRPDACLRHRWVAGAGAAAARADRSAEPLREDPGHGAWPAGDRGHDRRRPLDQRHAHLLARAAPRGHGGIHPRSSSDSSPTVGILHP